MEVELLFGRGMLPVELPISAQVTVLRKRSMPTVKSPEAAIAQALAQGVCVPPLPTLARGAKTACIAICDITRPVPNHLFLRPLIESLLACGISTANILVLVATGLHRPNLGPELDELIGDPWVTRHVSVANHMAREDADHIHVGTTRGRGTVVRLDRRFVQADLRIATGLVEPHFMAGYSGGRKVIAPGLAHAETITTFHNAHFMSDPGASNCNLRDNPLHEEQLEIVEMIGGALALNTVIDEQRRLTFVNFGEIVASHRQAVDFVRGYCEVPTDRRFPTVLTSAAGYPLDKTYYQTVKGMVGAIEILEPGGDLVVVSECSEGMGSPEFVEAQQRLIALGPEAFLRSILAKSHADIDEWQTQMQVKAMSQGRVHLFSPTLTNGPHDATGVARIVQVETALREILRRKSDHAIAVIPEGPYVRPFRQPPSQTLRREGTQEADSSAEQP